MRITGLLLLVFVGAACSGTGLDGDTSSGSGVVGDGGATPVDAGTTTTTLEVLPPLPGSEGVCGRVNLAAVASLFGGDVTEASTAELDDGVACTWESELEAVDIDFHFDPDWFADVVENDESGLYTQIGGLTYPAYDNGLGGIALLAPNGWTIELFPYVDAAQPDLDILVDAAVAATEE